MTNPTHARAGEFGDYRDAAAILGVSAKSVYRLAKFEPSFPRPKKIGRLVKFDLGEVTAWSRSESAASARTTPATAEA